MPYQVHAQDAVPADAVPLQSETVDQYEPKIMRMPVVNMSEAEIKAYENNPIYKPKLDSKPTGKKAQPSNYQFKIQQPVAS